MPEILEVERFTVAIVAKSVGVHVATVWRWILHGVRGRKLRSVMIGGRRWVLRTDLETFLFPDDEKISADADIERRGADAGRLLDAMGVTAKGNTKTV